MAKDSKSKNTNQETNQDIDINADINEDVAENNSETCEKEPEKKRESKEALLEKQLEESKESCLRIRAEYDNFRKRSAKEKEAAFNDSKANVLKEMLPIIDNFERALGTQNADAEALQKGLEMIYSSFLNTFEKLGVEAFGESGDAFDPNIHNAVMHIESEDFGENVVAQVFSKGYKLGDRIIRPAMVRVAN